MNRIAQLFTASLLLAGGVVAAPAEDVGGTVTPYSLNAFNGDADAIADALREVKRRGGISRFVMSGPGHKVRVNGMLDAEGYAALGDFDLTAVRRYMAQCYVYFLQFSGEDGEYCDYVRGWLERV